MAVNFTKNQNEITNAWRQVTDYKDIQNWALFGYEGNTNNIKLMTTGSNGLAELVQEFHCSLIQYAFCRVIDEELGINKLILINWQGDSSPLSRKGLCASHVGDVANYFKGCSLTLTIRNDDEATKEYLMDQITKSSSSSSSRLGLSKQPMTDTTGINTQVGSTYKKTDIKSEISADRKSFWQRQEEEEKERLIEERKRAAERQAQFEKERKLREETEAKKLAETIKERDRIIEATRQADRRESSNSQPSSILSANAERDDGDDERVGRRSELIRLERNQETQSLISKGLIKNKRAIFEQASQQQSQSPPNSSLTRRTSGVVVSQRLNNFKSLDISGESNANTEKFTNGLAKPETLDDTNRSATPKTVKKEVVNIETTPEKQEMPLVAATVSIPSQMSDTRDGDEKAPESMPRDNLPPLENGNCVAHTGEGVIEDSSDNSYSNNNDIPMKSPKQELKLEVDELALNGNYGIKAKALYDYQAADNTEISFDPNDIIGFIEKVDSGWWQGSVITGPYKGQSGLFPSNYVQEY